MTTLGRTLLKWTDALPAAAHDSKSWTTLVEASEVISKYADEISEETEKTSMQSIIKLLSCRVFGLLNWK